jgi:hypothetical protein
VFVLTDRDVAHSVKHPIERDLTFHPRKRRARARVDAATEPDVLADVLAV